MKAGIQATSCPWSSCAPILRTGLVLSLAGSALAASDPIGAVPSADQAVVERGAAGSVRTIGAYPEERGTGHTVTVLSDGRVFVYGHRPDANSTDSVLLDPKLRTKEINRLAPVMWDPKLSGWRKIDIPPECQNAAYLHTATALSNGRILIAGGLCDVPWGRDDNRVAPAHAALSLWNDDSRKWEAAPSLNEPRIYHTATLLADDSVIFIGGESDTRTSNNVEPVLASVELFSAGKLLQLPALHFARARHTSTRRADGSVIVVGGMRSDGKAMASVEIWDPARQSWSDGPPLTTARFGHTAALLSDGRLLVAGGIDQKGEPTLAVEIFDPWNNQWSDAAPLLISLKRLSSVVLDSDDILVAGVGYDRNHPYSRIMLWEKATAQWRPAGHLFPERYQGSLSYLLARMPHQHDSALVFDFKSVMQWSPSTAGATPYSPYGARVEYASTLLNDGRIMLAGGRNGLPNRYIGEAGLDWVEIFDPVSGRFSVTGRMNQPRHSLSALTLDDGRVVVASEWSRGLLSRKLAPPDFAEMWDPKTGQWGVIKELQSVGADWSQFEKFGKLRDGRVLFFFWDFVGEQPGYRALIWNPRTGAVDSKVVAAKRRIGPAIAITPQGQVLIVGFASGSDGNMMVWEPEVWDMQTGNVEKSRMPTGWSDEKAATLVLKNGDVLLVSAAYSSSQTASVSIWSAASGTWRNLPPLPINKDWDAGIHGLAELSDGTIITDALWLRPGTTSWAPVQRVPQTEASITQLRSGRLLALSSSAPHVAYFNEQYKRWDLADRYYLQRKENPKPILVELADGRLMVSGSLDAPGWPRETTTQIWDPKDDTWLASGKLMHIYTGNLEAVRLPSGQVMHLGFDRGGTLNCEIGHPSDNIWIDCGGSTPLAASRSQFTVGLLSTGQAVLMFGQSEVYAYNEQSTQWLPFSGDVSQLSRNGPGVGMNSFHLPDGCVISGPPFLIFNPATKKEIRPIVPVTGIKDGSARMVVLADGTVVVAGYPDATNDMGYGFFHRKATCAGFEPQDGDSAFMPAVLTTPAALAVVAADEVPDSWLRRLVSAIEPFKWFALAVLGPALLYVLVRRFVPTMASADTASTLSSQAARAMRAVLYVLGAIFTLVFVWSIALHLLEVAGNN